MKLVESLTVAIVTGRRIGAVPLMLRAIVALGALVAILATALAAWDVPSGYIALAAIFALVWTPAPDTHAGLAFLACLGMAWITGGSGEVRPPVVVTALALLVAHVAAALAGAMPVTAGADRRLVLRWARPTAGIAAAVVAAWALLAGFEAWSPVGSIVITVLALVLVTGAAWWWSVPSDRTDGGEPVPDA